MKRLIVVAAVVVAGCSATKTETVAETPLPPNAVVLATFTGEIDLATKTFVVRTTPAAPGAALRGPALQNLDADVTVSTVTDSVWIGDDQHSLCTNPSSTSPTWGANVAIESKLPAGTSMSGIYAEITRFDGLTGYESCSNDPGPAEMSSGYGLWSYQLVDADTGPIQKTWVFKYPAALGSKKTFSGRVVGVKIVQAPASSAFQITNTSYSFADTGTGIMVASNDNTTFITKLHLLDYAGAQVNVFATPATVMSMATAPGRIWYSTAVEQVGGSWRSYAGYSNTNGTSLTFALVPDTVQGASIQPTNIVADPVTPATRAWYLYNDSSYGNSYIRSYTPAAPATAWDAATTYAAGDRVSSGGYNYESLQSGNTNHPPAIGDWWKYSEFGPATALGNWTSYIAVGPDGRLYVSNAGAAPQSISVLSISGDTAVLVKHFPITGLDSCLNPSVINPGPNSKVYFAGLSDYSETAVGAVCSITTDGTSLTDPTFGKVGDAPIQPKGFAFGPGNELWGASSNWGVSSTVSRIAAGVAPYQVELPSYPFGWFSPTAVFRANGGWWVIGNSGLFKFTP